MKTDSSYESQEISPVSYLKILPIDFKKFDIQQQESVVDMRKLLMFGRVRLRSGIEEIGRQYVDHKTVVNYKRVSIIIGCL